MQSLHLSGVCVVCVGHPCPARAGGDRRRARGRPHPLGGDRRLLHVPVRRRIRWCSFCENHVCGAYLGLIPPFVWPFLWYCRQGCAGCTEKTNYYISKDEHGNGSYVLVKDRDTIGFGCVCCHTPTELEFCKCKRW